MNEATISTTAALIRIAEAIEANTAAIEKQTEAQTKNAEDVCHSLSGVSMRIEDASRFVGN